MKLITCLIIVGVLLFGAKWALAEAIPDYVGGSLYHRWNVDKLCYDEDSFRGTFQETIPTEGIDPDWVSASPKNDGCIFYFHPTQGQENAPITDDEKEITIPKELPKTGAGE